MTRPLYAVLTLVAVAMTPCTLRAEAPTSAAGVTAAVLDTRALEQLREFSITLNHFISQNPDHGDTFIVGFHLVFPEGSLKKKKVKADFTASFFGTQPGRTTSKKVKTGKGENKNEIAVGVTVPSGECQPSCAVVGTFKLRGGAVGGWFEPAPAVVLAAAMVVDPEARGAGGVLADPYLHVDTRDSFGRSATFAPRVQEYDVKILF